ncbi:MAG: hypothetical protein IRY95_04530 [Clostridia bacterium]|nr:hypothetical protein [Clostridia bacterium]
MNNFMMTARPYPIAPAPEAAPRPGRFSQFRRRAGARAFGRFLVRLLTAAGLLLVVAWRSSQVAALGDELAALQRQLRVAEAHNGHLEAEVLRLHDLRRIEAAADRLGMQARSVPALPLPTVAVGEPPRQPTRSVTLPLAEAVTEHATGGEDARRTRTVASRLMAWLDRWLDRGPNLARAVR